MVYDPLSFALNMCVSLNLTYVSCKQHIVESCLLSHSDEICVLIGVFGTLRFKVILA